MDKTKTMLGAIIGVMLTLGVVAYAASTYKIDVAVNDDTAVFTEASAGKAMQTTEQYIGVKTAAMLEREYISNVTLAMRIAYARVASSNDAKAMIAATQCMENAAKAIET